MKHIVLVLVLLLSYTNCTLSSSNEPHKQDAGPPERKGCIPHQGSGPRCPAVQLLDANAWKRIPSEEDPFLKMKTEHHKCLPLGTYVENGVFEIDTGLCNFATIVQPLQTEIRQGERLQFTLLHEDLSAPTNATAFVVLSIDGERIWQQEIPIPSEASYYQPLWTAHKEIKKGAKIVFHLHNHGANNWTIHSLTAGAL